MLKAQFEKTKKSSYCVYVVYRCHCSHAKIWSFRHHQEEATHVRPQLPCRSRQGQSQLAGTSPLPLFVILGSRRHHHQWAFIWAQRLMEIYLFNVVTCTTVCSVHIDIASTIVLRVIFLLHINWLLISAPHVDLITIWKSSSLYKTLDEETFRWTALWLWAYTELVSKWYFFQLFILMNGTEVHGCKWCGWGYLPCIITKETCVCECVSVVCVWCYWSWSLSSICCQCSPILSWPPPGCASELHQLEEEWVGGCRNECCGEAE